MPEIGVGPNNQLGDPFMMNPFIVTADPWSPGYMNNGWSSGGNGFNAWYDSFFGNGNGNLTITPNNDPGVVGGAYQNVPPQTVQPGDFGSNHGSLGANNPTQYPTGPGQVGFPIPIPGINWPTAIGGTILLNQAGILGGGGSSGGSSGGSGSGSQGGTSTVPIVPIGGGDGSNNQPGATQPIYPAGTGPATPTGAGMGPNEATGPTTQPIYPVGTGPTTPTGEGMGPNPSQPIYPAGTGPANPVGGDMGPKPATPVTPVIPGSSVGIPEPKGPGQTNTPLAPYGSTPGAGAGGASASPSPFIMPTLPNANYQAVPGTPANRNYYQEGLQSTQDLNALYGGMGLLYGNAANLYGSQDLGRYQNMIPGITQANQQLTGAANQQTVASNNALRLGNLQDATWMGSAQLDLLKQQNPEMYAQLAQQRNAASMGIDPNQYQSQLGGMLAGGGLQPGQLQTTLEQQAMQGLQLGKGLSAEDTRAAQQNARSAYAARGLGDSNSAMAAEVLNLDSMGRQREAQRQALAQSVDAQGFGQRSTGFGQNAALGTALMNADYGRQQQNFGNQNTSLQNQMATAFNPFSSQYQANSQNVGLNQQLFGNTAGMSSGAYGNQFVQNTFNPFNPYAQDIYAGNFNADNARYISANNNNAAIQGARTAGNNQLIAAGITGLGPSLFNSIFG